MSRQPQMNEAAQDATKETQMKTKRKIAAILALSVMAIACSFGQSQPTATNTPATLAVPTAKTPAMTTASPNAAPTTDKPAPAHHKSSPQGTHEIQPTTPPTPAPAPTEPVLTDERTDHPGPPNSATATVEIIASLPQDEFQCLPDDVRDGRVETSVFRIHSAWHADQLNHYAHCLSDQNIARLMVLPEVSAQTSLTAIQENCIATSTLGGMIRRTLPQWDDFPTFDAALFAAIAHFTLIAEICVPAETFSQLRLVGTELDRLKCITPTPQEAEELHNQIIQNGSSVLDRQIDAAAPCLTQFPPEVLIEPLPN